MKRFLLLLALISIVPWAVCRADDTAADPGKIVTDTNAPPVNLAAEVARAKSENKLLLLEFSSSDACLPCQVLQQRVFGTPEFQTYAKTNLNFVRLDFPLKVDLRRDTTATNELLVNQFEVYGFPTFIALNKNGKEFWRTPEITNLDAAMDWGTTTPKKFIDLLQQVEKLEK